MFRLHAVVVTAVMCGVVVLAPGCVAYRTGELKHVELRTQPGIAQTRPSALIEITCQTRGFTQNAYGDDIAAAQSFRSVVAGVLADSEMLSAYTFNAIRGTNMDLRIVCTLKHDQTGSPVAMVLSVATLCVVPFTGADRYQLATRLFGRNGKEVWSGVVEDSMRTWIQLFLLPLGSCKSEEKVRKQLLDNLVRTTLLRMNTGGHLNIVQ